MKEAMYLVNCECGDEHWARVMSAAEIFQMMDKEDCYPDELLIDVWRIEGVGEALTECSFCGKWHDKSDPQKMVIIGGGQRETGYGTEH